MPTSRLLGERVQLYGGRAAFTRQGHHAGSLCAPERFEARLWHLKGGQIYLPFGWRLQDSTAFVRAVSGIGMSTPERGAEAGR
jgi:hypothetical protein